MFKFFFKLKGWKVTHHLPKDILKCVIIAAPHTSNWDFLYAMGALKEMNINTRFTIKKEWFKFPFKGLMKKLGALPIDRGINPDGSRKGTVDAMVDLFNERKNLLLLITPEGTRSAVKKWKTGFYHVALNAKVPIALGFIDYENKVCGIDKLIYPTGNFNADMKLIMDFYKNIKGRNPNNFALDTTFES
jgi:1-acyl-sn-glycerol-3-phosphate acyltransferase